MPEFRAERTNNVSVLHQEHLVCPLSPKRTERRVFVIPDTVSSNLIADEEGILR
jgi:hypothetical protein